MRRLCVEGSWCSSQLAAEVDERFAAEVEERGRRRGERERLAPEIKTRITIRVFWKEGSLIIRVKNQDQNKVQKIVRLRKRKPCVV